MLPLFTLFEIPLHPQLFRALQAAGPRRAWNLMTDLYELNKPMFDAAQEGEYSKENLRSMIECQMAQAPTVKNLAISSFAEQFVNYGPKLQFHCTYITLWLNNSSILFDEVVEVEGLDHLHLAAAKGNGVLALPLHVGPSYVAGPLMAHHIPTQLVFNQMNFDEIKALAFPDLSVSGFQLDSKLTFRAGLTALRQGKVFSMFPEIDPRGVDNHHSRVPFLGTSVMAPLGPVLLSKTAHAPMVPVTVRPITDGKFKLTYHPAIPAPDSLDSINKALHTLWQTIEREVLHGDIGEWEMWCEFDRMKPDSSRVTA